MIVVRLATSDASATPIGAVSPAALELPPTRSVDVTWLIPVATL